MIATLIWQAWADTARFLPAKTIKPEVVGAKGTGKPVLALKRWRDAAAAAVAVICFEWLQRPENVVAGHLIVPTAGFDLPRLCQIVAESKKASQPGRWLRRLGGSAGRAAPATVGSRSLR
jgi:hypothetical protein